MKSSSNFYLLLFLFLVLNFGALALGSWLMADGPQSPWYRSLNLAPWTPPGWVFGVAWTSIMLCFSVYMALLVRRVPQWVVWRAYAFQLALNIAWNPVFFRWELPLQALAIIIALLALVTWFLFRFRRPLGWYSLLVLPYVLWLVVATSLNGYIVAMN